MLFRSILLVLALCTVAHNALAEGPASPPRAESRQVVAPRAVYEPPLNYPSEEHHSAAVDMRILVAEDGTVSEVVVQNGEEPFAGVALNYAKALRFEPARVDGVARAAWIHMRLEFEPPEPELPPPAPGTTTASGEVSQASKGPMPEEQVVSVVVEGERKPGATRVISDAETGMIPGAEGDPLRSIEAYPGTVPILASGPFIGVRGAPPGMVGYDYDGISVPYLFHLARGKAVVSPWFVQSATLYGTGGPGSLGRATGGTLVGTSADPEGRARAYARVLLSDSEAGVEVPLFDGRGSFMAAGRYSYTRPLVSLIAPEFTLDYWDYQVRARYYINEQDTLELLSFGAGDHSGQEVNGQSDDLFLGSFHRAAVRFSHQAQDKTSYRLSLVYGRDRWDARPSPIRPDSHSVMLDFSAVEPTQGVSTFSWGADAIWRFQNDMMFVGTQSVREYSRQDFLSAVWTQWQLNPSSRTSLSASLRWDLFLSGEAPNTPAAHAVALSPRLALSHQLSKLTRLHTSLGMGAQQPSRSQRPPGRLASVHGGIERSVLSDFGVELSLPANISFDTTAFHNIYFNVWDIEQLERLYAQVPDHRGQGQSGGLELLLRRTIGEHFVWFISYTLSKSWRSIGRVRAPAQYDRRNVVDLAAAYYFPKDWTISSRASYYSGFPARMTSVAAVANAPRTQPYFQLDWQVEKRYFWRESGRELAFTAGVLNTTLSSDSNDYYCTSQGCDETLVGPATVPTIGVEGRY